MNVLRELRTIRGLHRTLTRIKYARPDGEILAPDDLERMVDRFADRVAIEFQGESLTYAAFDAGANQVANWALELGLAVGENVAVFLPNRLEYIPIWFGLSKVGVVASLLNNQLIGSSLAHCINVAAARHVITDDTLAPAVLEARRHVAAPIQVWSLDGQSAGVEDLAGALGGQDVSRPGRERRAGLRGRDEVLKLFTSGTTGLPKAAKITHMRAQNYMNSFTAASMATAADAMLMVLPLYHATGGLCGVGCSLMAGGRLILEPKFSASRFWDVAADRGATMFMYVGELCRFLASSPPHPRERDHQIRVAIGNGLRPDVWERFQNRFAIPWIMEFYGATEGNVSMANFDNTVGAIGRIPPYLRSRFNVRLARVDLITEEPARGPDGFCIPCAPGEIGEALGEIQDGEARFRFEGYSGSAEQTKKKILRDAFSPGDAWFRTGDLMRQDKSGYFFFVDRLGDTFRWKSENVATSEVAEALGVFDGVTKANVYGVEVPGYEGRAGMAAITAGPELELSALFAHLERELPAFARPVFLRLQSADDQDTTGTFKFKKTDLLKQGFDPARISDPLYVVDVDRRTYIPLDAAEYARILSGDRRL